MRLVPSPRSLAARAPKLAGFALGVALPLILAGVVLAALDGGLSDSSAPPPPVYPVE